MSASLGGLIKDYRIKKKIPQLEVAYKIGWKDATILSRIEQGITKNPTKEIIDKICEAMKLEQADKNYILLSGGYLPTDEEIENLKKTLNPLINSSKYPINVSDFAWRIIHENEAAKMIHYKNEEDEKELIPQKLTALEITLNKKYYPSTLIRQNYGEDFFIGITAQYIYEQKNRTHQKWYIETIKRIMKNPEFRSIYNKAILYPKEKLVLDFATQQVKHRNAPDKILTFHMFNVPLYQDKRVFLEYLIPADLETINFYNK